MAATIYEIARIRRMYYFARNAVNVLFVISLLTGSSTFLFGILLIIYDENVGPDPLLMQQLQAYIPELCVIFVLSSICGIFTVAKRDELFKEYTRLIILHKSDIL
jgi:hypothetical protein